MECSGCGNKKAYKTYSGDGWEVCNECGSPPTVLQPDVYWDGKPEHGLPDDQKTGKPMVFGSKLEKAIYLKQNHLREAGDRVKGSKIHHTRGEHSADSVKSRDAVMSALAHVKNMGADYRRQEYLRITRESGRP